MNTFVFEQFKEISRFSKRDMNSFANLPFPNNREFICVLSKNVKMIIGTNYVIIYNVKTNAFGKCKVHKDDMNKNTTVAVSIAIAWARYKGECVPNLIIPITCKTENLKIGDIYYYHPQGEKYKVLAVYEDGFISHPVHSHIKPSFYSHSTVTIDKNII